MKTSRQILAVLVTALISIALTGSPALAAPPSNDTYSGAEAIAAVPFTTSLDTTEATTDADDAELNANCGAPATDASVWYALTPSADNTYLVDVSQSDYSAGALVATGAPGSFELLACGPGGTAWQATSGETYFIVVFDDQLDGAGNGGQMELTLEVAPPPPSIEATVEPVGTFNARTGSATIYGTVTCDSNADFAFVDVFLSQQAGRFTVIGFGGTEVICDGTSQPWSAEVFGESGLFKGGKAVSVTFALACNFGGCSEYSDETTVRLTGKK